MVNYAEFIGRLGTNEESDECYTPKNEVWPLFRFLDKTKIYYEATSDQSSSIIDGLSEGGYKAQGSNGQDFLTIESLLGFDGIITNPPYSKKTQFLEKCYTLGLPFALLLPVAAVQSQSRGKMFDKYGVSMLVYNRRVDFTGKKAPPFGVAWFMGNGFCEPNKLFFVDN